MFVHHKRHNRRVVQPARRHLLQVHLQVLFLQSSIARSTRKSKRKLLSLLG